MHACTKMFVKYSPSGKYPDINSRMEILQNTIYQQKNKISYAQEHESHRHVKQSRHKGIWFHIIPFIETAKLI